MRATGRFGVQAYAVAGISFNAGGNREQDALYGAGLLGASESYRGAMKWYTAHATESNRLTRCAYA